MAEIEIL